MTFLGVNNVGFNNPAISWGEFERRLSGNSTFLDFPRSHKRAKPAAKNIPRPAGTQTPYAELHAHSYFSFLDGASSPVDLVEEAVRLGLSGLALTDHDGFYGAAQFAEAAELYPELLTLYGSELSLGLSAPQNGVPDPEGDHLLVLAKGTEGYHRLAAAITEGQLSKHAEKGRPEYALDDLAERSKGYWTVLTGCRKGAVRRAMLSASSLDNGAAAAQKQIRLLLDRFGPEHLVVELIDHGAAAESAHNDILADIAARHNLPVVASNNVHYATTRRYQLAQTLAAIRARRSLSALDGWLPAGPTAFLRSGAEMAHRFRRYPGAIENTVTVAQEHTFLLTKAKPRLPKISLPTGHSQISYLREQTWLGAQKVYPTLSERAKERIEHELNVIEYKDFSGYFLIVKELVDFARSRGILCQGRGSAASSAVCYCLGVTAIDPLFYDLPFERFLNVERNEEPDIDVDFDSRRREEVIQHVYQTYGRRNAAQVCNVITYRPKFAVRDVAKALGYSAGQQDAWAKQLDGHPRSVDSDDTDIPADVVQLANDIGRFPRHLGIHSGGMVLTDRPVSEIVPIERARMEDRTVLQWDKDDCAYMGLVKFDLLGLGMLSAISQCFDMVEEHCGKRWDLSTIPREEAAVYDQLCLADSIGVFQVESRAQMGMLPRLRPRCFYDLVVEVGLVRPGPIQGGAVHPYMRRRAHKLGERGPGAEPESYDHPKLKPVLERTLGIPIFQEQLMQMAMAVADFDAKDADVLRRAMGSKRGVERIDSVKNKLFEGMKNNGIPDETAQKLYTQIAAFANFGFAESHSLSFALLVYHSAWLRLHYPAAFVAALLRAQPMGFYSPRTLIEDAKRHGVKVLGPDVLFSRAQTDLEPYGTEGSTPTPRAQCYNAVQAPVGVFQPHAPHDFSSHRHDGHCAVRLGLSSIKNIGLPLAERIESQRRQRSFTDIFDLSRRCQLNADHLESLALAGALASLNAERRSALWLAGPASQEREGQLPGTAVAFEAPVLPFFDSWDEVVADLATTGISPEDHPVRHMRASLRERNVLSAKELLTTEPGKRVRVGGLVTHRQRPATAQNTTFINLEDETGLVNVVCSEGLWRRYRSIANNSRGLIIRGLLERTKDNVVNIIADKLDTLEIPLGIRSRDFQ